MQGGGDNFTLKLSSNSRFLVPEQTKAFQLCVMSPRHALNWGSPSPTPDGMLSDYVIRRECGTAPAHEPRQPKAHSAGLRPGQSQEEDEGAQPSDNNSRPARRDLEEPGSSGSSPAGSLADSLVIKGQINSDATEDRLGRSRQCGTVDSLVIKGLMNSVTTESRMERSREFTSNGKGMGRNFTPTGGAKLGMDKRPPSRQCDVPMHLNSDGRLAKAQGTPSRGIELRWAQYVAPRPVSRHKSPALATADLDLPPGPLVGNPTREIYEHPPSTPTLLVHIYAFHDRLAPFATQTGRTGDAMFPDRAVKTESYLFVF